MRERLSSSVSEITEIRARVAKKGQEYQNFRKNAGQVVRRIVLQRLMAIKRDSFPRPLSAGLDPHDEPGVIAEILDRDYLAYVLFPNGLYRVPMGDGDFSKTLITERKRVATAEEYLEFGAKGLDALEKRLQTPPVNSR